MKKIIITIVCILSILSCDNHCKEDIEFKELYFSKLDAITLYGKLFDTNKEVPLIMERSSQFYDNVNYLEYLTYHEFRYFVLDYHPVYLSQSDLKEDIKDLKKWYRNNKCGMTIAKADSIVNATYKQQFTGEKDTLHLDSEVPCLRKAEEN